MYAVTSFQSLLDTRRQSPEEQLANYYKNNPAERAKGVQWLVENPEELSTAMSGALRPVAVQAVTMLLKNGYPLTLRQLTGYEHSLTSLYDFMPVAIAAGAKELWIDMVNSSFWPRSAKRICADWIVEALLKDKRWMENEHTAGHIAEGLMEATKEVQGSDPTLAVRLMAIRLAFFPNWSYYGDYFGGFPGKEHLLSLVTQWVAISASLPAIHLRLQRSWSRMDALHVGLSVWATECCRCQNEEALQVLYPWLAVAMKGPVEPEFDWSLPGATKAQKFEWPQLRSEAAYWGNAKVLTRLGVKGTVMQCALQGALALAVTRPDLLRLEQLVDAVGKQWEQVVLQAQIAARGFHRTWDVSKRQYVPATIVTLLARRPAHAQDMILAVLSDEHYTISTRCQFYDKVKITGAYPMEEFLCAGVYQGFGLDTTGEPAKESWAVDRNFHYHQIVNLIEVAVALGVSPDVRYPWVKCEKFLQMLRPKSGTVKALKALCPWIGRPVPAR